MGLRGDQAAAYFMKGYNCAQSTAAPFADLAGLSEESVLRMASGFGAGIGRLREVCGAVNGAVLILSLLYGSPDPQDKTAIYTHVQDFAGRFRSANGYDTLICRQLLGLEQAEGDPTASARTERYYESRPCLTLVRLAADLLEEYIRQHPYHD